MSSDPNKHQNELAAKLTAHQNAKAIEDATIAVLTAIKPFTEDERKLVLDKALEELGSSLGRSPQSG